MTWDYTNDYSSTLYSSYTSGGTSLVVVSVSGLPASGRYFILKIELEYFLCTSYTGTTLTVVGAQAGSTAANHSSAAAITGCWIVPSVLDGIRSDQSQVGTYANLPTSGMKTGDRYTCTNRRAEFIYNGSNWDMFYMGLYVPGPFTALPSFSWRNQGLASIITEAGDTEFLIAPLATGDDYKCREINVPGSTPWTITVCLLPCTPKVNYSSVGLFLSDGTKLITLPVDGQTNFKVAIGQFSSVSSYSSTPLDLGGIATINSLPIMARITDDGTNHIFGVSSDGVNWYTAQQSRTAYMTATKIGYCANSNNATSAAAVRIINWKQT